MLSASALQLPISLDEFHRILKRYGVVSASVFGSYARGDARPDSDLDLLVTYGPDTNLLQAMSLQDELETATGTPVDIVSEKYIKPRLAERIKPDLIRLF